MPCLYYLSKKKEPSGIRVIETRSICTSRPYLSSDETSFRRTGITALGGKALKHFLRSPTTPHYAKRDRYSRFVDTIARKLHE